MTVRATNGGSLQSTATSDGVTPDNSAPSVTGTPRDGLGADISYQTSTTTISANWAGCFSDSQSGIAGYEWAIYVSGGTNIQPYTSVGTATSATNSSLSLTPGTTYIVNVRATNGAGLTRLTGTNGVMVDATPPTVTGVPNDGLGADVDSQTSTTVLSANWAGVFADAQSGVTAYEWAIGTTFGGTNVQNYTSVGTSTSATNSSLSLSVGAAYYVTVRASNGAGLQTTSTSDGVTVMPSDTTPPTVAISRQTPAGGVTNLDTVTFLVDFNEDVQNVDAADFALSLGGTLTSGALAVGSNGDSDASTYTVTVPTIAGDGLLDLSFAPGQNIRDLASNAFNPNTGITSEQTYTISHTRTWDGGGGADHNWTTAANWADDVLPRTGDRLVFGGAAVSVNNNFTAGTVFDSITFNTGGFTVSGNSVKLTPAGGVAISNVAGQNTVNLSITADSTGTAVVQAGTLQLAPGAQGLVLNGGGVDIQSGRLVFNYSGSSPAEAVRAALTTSYDGGHWDLGKLRSTTAWGAGLTLGSKDDGLSQVTVMATYAGDFNLDGSVDGVDVNTWTANFGIGTVWQLGDANYDGVVNGLDLDLVNQNFGKTPIAGTLGNGSSAPVLAPPSPLVSPTVAGSKPAGGININPVSIQPNRKSNVPVVQAKPAATLYFADRADALIAQYLASISLRAASPQAACDEVFGQLGDKGVRGLFG